MAKQILIGLIVAWLMASESFAVLPPLAQTKRELLAILSDERFLDNLPSAALLEKITKEQDGYLITTQQETMFVEVIDLHSNRIGPIQFELKFHPPVSIHNK